MPEKPKTGAGYDRPKTAPAAGGRRKGNRAGKGPAKPESIGHKLDRAARTLATEQKRTGGAKDFGDIVKRPIKADDYHYVHKAGSKMGIKGDQMDQAIKQAADVRKSRGLEAVKRAKDTGDFVARKAQAEGRSERNKAVKSAERFAGLKKQADRNTDRSAAVKKGWLTRKRNGGGSKSGVK